MKRKLILHLMCFFIFVVTSGCSPTQQQLEAAANLVEAHSDAFLNQARLQYGEDVELFGIDMVMVPHLMRGFFGGSVYELTEHLEADAKIGDEFVGVLYDTSSGAIKKDWTQSFSELYKQELLKYCEEIFGLEFCDIEMYFKVNSDYTYKYISDDIVDMKGIIAARDIEITLYTECDINKISIEQFQKLESESMLTVVQIMQVSNGFDFLNFKNCCGNDLNYMFINMAKSQIGSLDEFKEKKRSSYEKSKDSYDSKFAEVKNHGILGSLVYRPNSLIQKLRIVEAWGE